MEKITTYKIKEVKWPRKTFVAKRATLPFDQLNRFFAESYKEIYTALNKSGLIPVDPPFAVYFSVDAQKMVTDLAAAVVIPESAKVPDGFVQITIPESNALLLNYSGSYDNMTNAYEELDNYVEKHQLKKSWVLEQYFSDPLKEPDPNKWKTDIYYITGP